MEAPAPFPFFRCCLGASCIKDPGVLTDALPFLVDWPLEDTGGGGGGGRGEGGGGGGGGKGGVSWGAGGVAGVARERRFFNDDCEAICGWMTRAYSQRPC